MNILHNNRDDDVDDDGYGSERKSQGRQYEIGKYRSGMEWDAAEYNLEKNISSGETGCKQMWKRIMNAAEQ